MHLESPTGGTQQLVFVRCSACRAPVGVLPYHNSHAKLEQMDRDAQEAYRLTHGALASMEESVRGVILYLQRQAQPNDWNS